MTKENPMLDSILSRTITDKDWIVDVITPSNPNAKHYTEQGSEWVSDSIDIREFVTQQNQVPHKEDVCGKAIAPINLLVGGKRKRDNIHTVNCLVYDIDKVSKDEVQSIFTKIEAMAFAVHTTFSNTIESLSLRLLIPVSRKIVANEFRLVWNWMASEVGEGIDQQCKDPSRQYLPPSSRINSKAQCKVHAGGLLDIDKVLELAKKKTLSVSPRQVR